VGGLGYIGGRLASFLLKNAKAEIYLTTRRENGNIPKWVEDFHVFNMNILDDTSVERCLRLARPDTVIHLAAVDQSRCLDYPQEAHDVNVKGTERLLAKAYQEGVERFVYFSTFHVYGRLPRETTEQSPLRPAHPYAESKLKAEELIREFHHDKKMQTIIFRLSNSYGYPMDNQVGAHVWTLVFNAFCKQAIEEGKITIRSNQYRNFITLDDVARAVHHFLFTMPSQWKDGIFNLGGEKCLQVQEAAQEISRVYEKHYNRGAVKIEAPSKDQDEEYQPFHYNIEKLRRTDFRLCDNTEKEILGTLRLCENNLTGRA